VRISTGQAARVMTGFGFGERSPLLRNESNLLG
jgi:hypothetical protein